MITSRRSFLTGLCAALITAPAIVRVSSIMPVKHMIDPYRDLNIVGTDAWGRGVTEGLQAHTLWLTETGEPITYWGYDLFIGGGFRGVAA